MGRRLCFTLMLASPVPAQSMIQSGFSTEAQTGGQFQIDSIDLNVTSLKIFKDTALQQYPGNLFSINTRCTLTKWIARVTTGPVQNGPNLFNEILSCSSGTAGQKHKSCSRSMHRGENFDLHLYLGPKYPPTPPHTAPHGTKGPGHNQNLNTGKLSEAKGPLTRKILCWLPLP